MLLHEARADDDFDNCLLEQIKDNNSSVKISDITEHCNNTSNVERAGIISQRIQKERETEFSPYVITPHRMNYILPALSTNNVNREAYSEIEGLAENFSEVETKIQLSLKIPLNYNDIVFNGDQLFFGFTLEAWWQVYADNISKPFRETNYRPEFFYFIPLAWKPFNGSTDIILGVEHQSNGQTQILSRSWNRVYANFLYEIGNVAFSLRPWWRIPEDDKEFPLDPGGDDNPDIEDFMGNFEFASVYKWQSYELGFLGRQNFSTERGSAELNFTFPLGRKLRGLITVFDGYGESLIDYNHKQTRFGLGITINELL